MGKVPLESHLVHSLFKCTLCNGLIRSATAIDECLHRFCKICISKHFENSNETKCPTCHETVAHPLESLKPDPTFQRLLYKLFPSVFQREINYKPSLLSAAIANESPRIHFDSTINVHLDYWDLSSDLFPNSNSSTVTLPSCYLECIASAPLKLIEKFIRLRYSLPSDLQIDLFYERFLLDREKERLIDICCCFDQLAKNQTLNLRFLVSPFGYETILKRIRQSRQPLPETTPLQIEITETSSRTLVVDPSASPSASSCDSTSIDPKLKVKIRRSDTSQNNWYIPQTNASTLTTTILTPGTTAVTPIATTTTATTNATNEPVGLPDLVNSCEISEKIVKRKGDSSLLSNSSTTPKKKSCPTSVFFSAGHVSQPNRTSILKPRSKPQRRTRFIPTMVQVPPSICDRINLRQFDYSDQESDTSLICPTTNFSNQTVTTMRPSEMVIVNVEGNVSDPLFDTKKTSRKTICKVPPYIPEPTASVNISPPEKTSTVIKPTAIYPTLSPNRRTMLPKRTPSLIPPVNSRSNTSTNDTIESSPLDLSLK